MDAVAAGAAAGHHDEVARLHRGIGVTPRHDADGAAEHQRIADVARVERDGAGDRGDAHPIAVVADAGGHAGEQPPGMDHAGWDVGRRGVGRGDAEHVEVGDRLGAEAGAEHVADHAAEAGRRAAVGLDRRGMVVGLDLHADVVVAVEPHHARVVLEHAHTPVARTERVADRLRGGEHRLLEEVVVAGRPGGADVIDAAGERLVAAVLAPGLRDRLQLDLERGAAEGVKVVADSVQLADGQGQAAVAAELFECGVVETVQRDRLLGERPGAAAGERGQHERPDDHVLDGVVGEEFLREPLHGGGVERRQPILPQAADHDAVAERGGRGLGGEAGRIGDARLGEHVDDRRQPVERLHEPGRPELSDERRFRDGVGEQNRGQTLDVGAGELPLEQPAGGGAGPRAGRDAERLGAGRDLAGGMVAGGIAERDVNFPEHLGCPWHG